MYHLKVKHIWLKLPDTLDFIEYLFSDKSVQKMYYYLPKNY
jgi:hypothetical protein